MEENREREVDQRDDEWSERLFKRKRAYLFLLFRKIRSALKIGENGDERVDDPE